MKSGIDGAAVIAAQVIGGYMRAAIAEIDGQFGDGFAASNTVLLAGFIQAMAIDREVSGVKQAIEISS